MANSNMKQTHGIEASMGETRDRPRSNEIREQTRQMKIENDGGLLFCWLKRNVIGLLLTEDQIQASINLETQRKKKKGKGKPTEKDKEQARLVEQVENS